MGTGILLKGSADQNNDHVANAIINRKGVEVKHVTSMRAIDGHTSIPSLLL